MRIETAMNALELALDYPACADILTVEFSGGEPLLNFKLIRDFIPRANKMAETKGKKLSFSIQTNGTLFNDENIIFLKDNNVDIGISIDGTADVHDKNRVFPNGTGSNAIIVANISKLRQHGITPSLLAVVSSAEQYDSVVQFANENSIKEIRTNLVTKAGRAEGKDEYTVDYEALADKYIKVCQDILEGKLQVNDATLTFFLWNLILNQPHMCFRSPCGAGKNQVSVTSDGNLYPCQGWRNIHDKPLGNVNELKSLKETLDFSERVNGLRKHNVRCLEICQECECKAFCGVCPREIYTETGSLNQRIGVCSFQRKVFSELMWLFVEYEDQIKEYLLGAYA